MENLLPLFSSNILPILITAGLGFVLAKTVELDPRTLSRVIFFLFSPCLVFNLLVDSQLEQSAIVQMLLFAILAQLLVALLAFLVAWLLKLPRTTIVAIVLAASMTNSGNFGLSFNRFAFGEEALTYAGIYFIASNIMVYAFGVPVASMGKSSIKDSLLNLFKFPVLYAVLLAAVFIHFNWSMPTPIDRAIDTLGDGTIPGMLVLLGMQLGQADLKGKFGPIALASGMRLVAAPLIAFALAIPFGLTGTAYQAGISQASTPTAVMTTALSTEFDIEPSLVSTIVAATTILSPLTLTPLLVILGGNIA